MQDQQTYDANSDAVRTHLNIMQGVIQRMAENSRSCKVWGVTLVSAVLVLSARTENANHTLIALIPTLLFWVLDAYYLGLERGFRSSYSTFVERIHRAEVSLIDLYPVGTTGSTVGHFLWALVLSFAVAPFYVVVLATVIVARLVIV